MLYFILLIALMAVLSPWLSRFRWSVVLFVMAPLVIFILLLCQISPVVHGDFVSVRYPWMPDFGVYLSFYLDGLSLLFGILITGIGALIVLYSDRYLADHPQKGRFFCYLFAFMASMLGAVFSSNLISLFVFWELTSITSYLLISFNHQDEASRRAAFQGLLVTVGGGLAMLAGFVLINLATNHFGFNFLLHEHGVLVKSHYYTAIVILVLLGAFTKSAQFPFHFWLPNAMCAPTPVSAYLHSATMVQLGIYIVARLTPSLGHTQLWTMLLLVIPAITIVVSSVLLLRARDLKQILAYSTVIALSALFFLLAPGTRASVEAAMAFLLAHALYKAGLFLSAGNIDHATGTRDIMLLGGLRKRLPKTCVAVILTAASMAGLPPVLGFVTKELIYEAKLMAPELRYWLLVIVFVANVVFVLVAMLMLFKVFWGKDKRGPGVKLAHEVTWQLWFPPLLVGFLGLLFGLLPNLIDGNLVAPALSSVLQNPMGSNLALWHGLSMSLLLSFITIVIAVGVFFAYPRINQYCQKQTWWDQVGPEALYQYAIVALGWISWTTCRSLQRGSLRTYMLIIFAFLVLLTGITFFSFKHLEADAILPHTAWYNWAIAMMMLVAAFATVTTKRYLASLTFLSVAGVCSTLIFLIYSAPDVAMTQVLVDVLTIVIMVLALYRLPQLPVLEPMSLSTNLINGVAAILVGLVVTAILLSVVSVPFDQFINDYYSQHSLTLGQGKNIVNVILVDFRALDTFGEMIVVGIASLGVYSLLKTPKHKGNL
jgi:multicomponent Na+:H+ antiporter subunit A